MDVIISRSGIASEGLACGEDHRAVAVPTHFSIMKEFRGTKESPFHLSCGGVVFRPSRNGEIKVLLLHRFKNEGWPYDSWHLPKGTRRTKETEKDTVIREVLEETGYEVKPAVKLGYLRSTYTLDATTIRKTTLYYACNPIRRVGKGDSEHDEIRWLPLQTAIEKLSEFPEWEKEEQILLKFKRLLENSRTILT